jgi:hypothetical protein
MLQCDAQGHCRGIFEYLGEEKAADGKDMP